MMLFYLSVEDDEMCYRVGVNEIVNKFVGEYLKRL